MKKKDYRLYHQSSQSSDYKKVFLPKDEYAFAMSELNSHMSDDDRTKELLVKPIGD